MMEGLSGLCRVIGAMGVKQNVYAHAMCIALVGQP